MSANRQVEAFRCSDRENIRIVGEQDIRSAGNNKIFCACQIPGTATLMIDADQIQSRIAESQRLRLPAQEANPVSRAIGVRLSGVRRWRLLWAALADR